MHFFSGNSQAAIWCYWTCETEDWAAAGSVDHSRSLWITCGDASASVCMIHELLMIRFCCICRQEYLWIEIHITAFVYIYFLCCILYRSLKYLLHALIKKNKVSTKVISSYYKWSLFVDSLGKTYMLRFFVRLLCWGSW